jgi:predicted RNA-binding protein with PUA-like domain
VIDRSAEKICKHRLGAKKYAVAYYLLKSEGAGPRKFTIADLAASPLRSTTWDGVRNFQARNILLSMQAGDFALFYHSNCRNAGVAGIVEVIKEAYVDETQFDSSNPDAYDSKATREEPRWYAVDVRLQLQLPRLITLEELKQYAVPGGPLEGMLLFTRARLSVQPLRPEHFQFILRRM